ncbi:enoyl-CoA hydratase/isomerase family protein [Streptomyces durbertensis]|uniref:Enoyl-CoA hydratase/isomerase family protein n=1 Tax=Streptomyces durbertensis TaxID=2448886 RepID=A0ABR6EB32_9ACTN|nr:enoyl-CoA hydratase-related protein [Streptomyces durbertensis]MBB1242383.1 enoyl-CoA hydratase/isomerase family protein [Streptomyces durbertensis]
MSGPRAVVVSRGRDLLRVEMARPRQRNPIDDTLLTELAAALDEAEADPGCRVLVLGARGADFCSGTDLSGDRPVPGDGLAAGAELPYWRLLDRLTRSELVTVAVVDGRATAGGVGLAAACDLVVAGERASFRLTEMLVGLVPAMALPFVARRVGEQRAFAATLRAEEFDSEAARAAGLADLVGADAERVLRPLLAALGRTDRATTAALKRYRARLFPRDERLGHDASHLLLERFAAPGTRALLDRAQEAGAA